MKERSILILALLLLSGFLGVLPTPVFAATVNLTLTISKGQGGPTGTFTLSGCSIGPTSILGDGTAYAFTATNSCVVTVTAPTDNANSQYRFAYVATLPNQGLNTNSSSTFTTCASGTCSGRSYTAFYEPTFASQDYGYSTWGNGLFLIKNDTHYQGTFAQSGSTSLTWAGYEGWCDNANTTSPANTISSGDMSVTVAGLMTKYQQPYMVQDPVDGYASAGCLWGTKAILQYSDLATFKSNNQTCPSVANSCANWVRVDTMSLASQYYRDLVNIKNNFNTANSKVLQYWDGINNSDVASDGGMGPGANDGQNTGWRYANSQYCIVNKGAGKCSGLLSYVHYTSAGMGTTALNYITNTIGGGKGSFGNYVVLEHELGMLYAMYNFSNKYGVGHPFTYIPSKFQVQSVPTAQYPFPYNTTYIESLDLFKYFAAGYGDSANGNYPNSANLNTDLSSCSPKGYFGSYLSYNTVLGGLLQATSSASSAANLRSQENLPYYQAYCAGSSIEMPGQFVAYDPAKNITFWSRTIPFSLLLSRMQNVGNLDFLKNANGTGKVKGNVVMSAGWSVTGAVSSTTNMTVLGGRGVPLLLWVYTNRTATETLTLTVPIVSQMHLSTTWCAVSLFNLAVLSCAGGSTITLSGVKVAGSSAGTAPGWNPIYVFNFSTNFQPLYQNVRLMSSNIGPSSATYTYSGIRLSSNWAVIHSEFAPTLVSVNSTGNIKQAASLSALNSTFIGLHWDVGSQTWQNFTGAAQTGYWYDSVNHLLYVHFQMWKTVKLTVNAPSGGSPLPTVPVSLGVAAGVAAAVTAGAYYFRRRRILEDWA